ncbi:MAG: hypothetical protein AAFR34_07365 [Pseudomonadota bacterium]
MRAVLLALATTLAPLVATADPAMIDAVEARKDGDTWRFSVTLSHGDTGWDDYANGWRIEAPDGTVLGYRELLHPHVDEQPFTRSLSGVEIPEGMTTVMVRASTNADGWDDTALSFDLGGS